MVTIDIEPTNRCNADCSFCPRDKTPHQGLMEPETFAQVIARVIEFRDEVARPAGIDVAVALCGLGEPLLNRHLPDYVRKIREAGFPCTITSNASLLDEKRARRLLDAGVTHVDLNVGEREEDYEQVYRLSWKKTYENVLRFATMAEGKCSISMVLVNHREDPERTRAMKQFWSDHGLKRHLGFSLINRGGALEIEQRPVSADDLRHALAAHREHTAAPPACIIPFVSMFVGYDGQHYLCCSDWTKQKALGSVFERSLKDVLREKFEMAVRRDPICRTCNLDPLSILALERSAMLADEIPASKYGQRLKDMARSSDRAAALLESMGVSLGTAPEPRLVAEDRRRLPIVAP